MCARLSLFAILSLCCWPAFAYLGPGVGAGAVATVFGILGALLLAVVGIVYFPIKRAIKQWRNRKTTADTPTKDTQPPKA